MALRSSYRSWILASFAVVNIAACAALEASGGTGDGGGAAGAGWGNSGGNGGVIDYDASPAGGSIGEFAKLCGRGPCDVGAATDARACGTMAGTGGEGGSGGAGGVAAGTGTGGSGGASTGTGTGGSGGSSATTGTGGSGGASTGATTGTGGSGDTTTGTGGAGTGGGSGTGGAATGSGGSSGSGAVDATIECKLVLTEEGVGRTCVASGAYTELSPCNSAADCGPGLGCVLAPEQGTAVCRRYCCGDVEACAPQTFCAPQPMAEAADPAVVIPVCVDADDCTLLEADQCTGGLVCTVVRADGTTACMLPGEGKQGQICPCAPGFACTKLVDQCRKICHTTPGNPSPECETGFKCQGNGGLPEGFGLCVSTNEL